MKQRIALLAVALLAVLASPTHASIVVNGTFDDNTTGWSGSYLVLNGPGGGFPEIDTGTYFQAGNTASTTITQIYNLTLGELADLASGGLNYVISGDLFGFSVQNDNSTFIAEFFDGAAGTGASLGSVSLSSLTNDPGSWPSTLTAGSAPSFQSESGSLLTDTQSILFSVVAQRTAGLSNDGYADNLAFTLTPAVVDGGGAVPEPAMLLTWAGLACCGLAAANRRG